MKNKILCISLATCFVLLSCNNTKSDRTAGDSQNHSLNTGTSNAENRTDIFDKLKNCDLTAVFNPDSITDDGNNRYDRPELLGYIGTNYQRFQIHFTSFAKDKINPYQYNVSGKTKVKENICNFIGTVTIVTASYDTSNSMEELGFPACKGGYITTRWILNEDETLQGSGEIKGKMTTNIYFDDKNKIHYNALMLAADNFCNNQFTGNWTSYKTGKTKKCNFGDFRIPDSGDFDGGVGEFVPDEKYLDNGWRNFYNSQMEYTDETKRLKAEKMENTKWWQ